MVSKPYKEQTLKKSHMHGIPGKKHKYLLYGIRKHDSTAHNLAERALVENPSVVAYFITPGKHNGEDAFGVYVRYK
jgi:hypothetical protein